MGRMTWGFMMLSFALAATPPAMAQSTMVQCGQQYQAAKAAGTLNGASWNQYRTECAARLKAQPASAAAPAAPAAAPVAVPAAASPAVTTPGASLAPATAKSTAPASGGRAAMLTRQKQCGAEWRAQKATLVAQNPSLKWPQYWSQCNTRLKAAGQ